LFKKQCIKLLGVWEEFLWIWRGVFSAGKRSLRPQAWIALIPDRQDSTGVTLNAIPLLSSYDIVLRVFVLQRAFESPGCFS